MSIATALAALKTQFETDCASLTDTRLALDCTLAIERWYAAASNLATEEANAIQSYSRGGLSISRRQLEEQRSVVSQLRAEIAELLYGGAVILADHSCGSDSATGAR